MSTKHSSFFLMIVCLLALFFAGCTETKYLTRTVYMPYLLDEALLTTVKPTAPPSREAYIGVAGTDEKILLKNRIKLLRELNTSLYADVDICNKRLYNISLANKVVNDKVNELNKKGSK